MSMQNAIEKWQSKLNSQQSSFNEQKKLLRVEHAPRRRSIAAPRTATRRFGVAVLPAAVGPALVNAPLA